MTPTHTYTTSDLSRRTGDVIAAAYKGPVTLTQRSKARFVLITVELFDELVAKADPRRVGKTREMPEELAAEFSSAVDAYVTDGAE
jgi:prevent-host-death family protein